MKKWEVADRPKGVNRRVAEGWLFNRGPAGDYIVRDPSSDSPIFKNDREAVAFVIRRATEGSEYHAECLAYALAQRMMR